MYTELHLQLATGIKLTVTVTPTLHTQTCTSTHISHCSFLRTAPKCSNFQSTRSGRVKSVYITHV